MIELTEEDLIRKVGEREGEFAVLVYTPLCGTCKLALRMFGIVSEAIPGMAVYQCNINFAPMAVRTWNLTTVPSVLLFNEGQLIDRLNRIQSVDALFRFFKRETNGDT
ncbi:co-chaperone YbbN [Paenibacillus sp. J2TS4]|uniref:thioredoxin family protein n=1 Tax=Paenibacillus sp. J2TS4 TaxID=2807194 RepID=UPI001BCC6120|nr:thioredoxin family protein [Paenibacillus sp. J2TS4]